MVPVAALIWLSMTESVPVARFCPPGILRRDGDIALLQGGANPRQRIGRQRDIDEDGVGLVDGDDPGEIARAHDVAGIDQPGAGAPVDRRADAAVVELHLRHVDGGLVGLDAGFQLRHQGFLGVQLLRGGGPGFDEPAVTIEVETGIVEQRLILGLVGLRLLQRRRVRRRVDLDQHVAGVHVLALGKVDLDDLAVDPRAYQHAVQGLHGAEPGELDRNIGALDLAGHHRNGGRGGARAGGRGRRPQSPPQPEIGQAAAGNEDQHHQPPAAHARSSPPPKVSRYKAQ